jgi:hypothetical protein
MANERRHRRFDDEHWLQSHWRPMMAWSYFVICLFDFFAAPIFMALLSAYTKTPAVTWVPLTIQGGSIYHISMGAIIGITSWGRSQEKVTSIKTPIPTTIPDLPVSTPTVVTPPASVHGKVITTTVEDEPQ